LVLELMFQRVFQMAFVRVRVSRMAFARVLGSLLQLCWLKQMQTLSLMRMRMQCLNSSQWHFH